MAITGADGMNIARSNVTGQKRERGSFASSMDVSAYAAAVGVSGGVQNCAPSVNARSNTNTPSGGSGINNSIPTQTISEKDADIDSIIDRNSNAEENQLHRIVQDAEAERRERAKWQIVQDTQNKIYEIQHDTQVERGRGDGNMFGKWDEVIKS